MTFITHAAKVPSSPRSTQDLGCPLCGAVVHYRGLTSLSCAGRDCQNYEPSASDALSPAAQANYFSWQKALTYAAAGFEVQWCYTAYLTPGYGGDYWLTANPFDSGWPQHHASSTWRLKPEETP